MLDYSSTIYFYFVLAKNRCIKEIKNHGYLKTALRRWERSAIDHALTAEFNQCVSKFPHSEYDFVFYLKGNPII